MFLKIGEALEIAPNSIQEADVVLSNPEITERFQKLANGLKKIAPKADNFLYFSAVMMHAAEASLINADGSPKLDRYGKTLTGGFEENGEGLKWVCSDNTTRPFKNNNGDIFPHKELIKAYKNWVGKPLCIDHKSNSVDAIRGVILDTYYDYPLRRVVALCALDKVSYPDLAHKVASGYATSVSMGTGVGKAICFDCGQVARTERDFCVHMQTKSSYGEINMDLQPIELSIVVNGADPQAKIREIIASANILNNYIENKQIELVKTSGLTASQISEVEKDMQDLSAKLNKLKDDLRDVREEMKDASNADTMTDSKITPEESNLPDTDSNVNVPARYAADEQVNDKINELSGLVQEKFAILEKNIEKLSNKLHFTKEEIMSSKENMNKKAYFQGAGGVNEPTPGKVKYEKDPLNEELRNKGDKHMVGQAPFPGVGDVKGLHPSPASADEKSELKRKELLSRAEQEQRAMRRQAALEKAKNAYFQGGGGANEPTPGKKKYEVNPLNETARNKTDKHMVGQAPFPGVGKVDGLHPSPASADEKDELKRKEMLARASLKAKFVKAANADGSDNMGKSAWHIFMDDKLVLTASVDDLTGGKSELFYNSVATKPFGTEILTKVRDLGVKEASAVLFKGAQVPAAPVAPAPTDPGMAMTAVPAELPADLGVPAPATDVQDEGGAGDKSETAAELAEQAVKVVSDLKEAVDVMSSEAQDAAEMAASLPPGKTASINNIRKSLGTELLAGMKKTIASLQDGIEEMNLISDTFKGNEVAGENAEFVNNLATEAFSEMKETLAGANDLKIAFSRFARGTAELVKMAEGEMAHVDHMDDMDDFEGEDHEHEDHEDLDLDALLDELARDEHVEVAPEADHKEDVSMADTQVKTKEDAEKALDAMKPGDTLKMTAEKKSEFDLTTKAGRDAYRAKLAADMKYNEALDDAHPKGGSEVDTDSKVSGDLAHVEDLQEQQKADLQVANAPVKVRKEAERLFKLVSAGKIAHSDVDALIAQGLDAAVVAYYKNFYGQMGPEGKNFAKDLTTEHMKAKAEAEMSTYRVKIARAYEMANEMVRKGLLDDTNKSVAGKVDEIMKWNDEAFDSMKRMLSRHASTVVKTASKLPSIGEVDSFDGLTSTASSEDLVSELTKAFASKRNGY